MKVTTRSVLLTGKLRNLFYSAEFNNDFIWFKCVESNGRVQSGRITAALILFGNKLMLLSQLYQNVAKRCTVEPLALVTIKNITRKDICHVSRKCGPDYVQAKKTMRRRD